MNGILSRGGFDRPPTNQRGRE